MKTETSAGGVIFRSGPTGNEVLLLKDMNGNWTFPKGLIDPGESAETAAVREIAEETGIRQVRLLASLPDSTYTYTRNGLIHKTVRYFVFAATGIEQPVGQQEEGISAVEWVPYARAVDIIGYPKTNAPLLAQAAFEYTRLCGTV